MPSIIMRGYILPRVLMSRWSQDSGIQALKTVASRVSASENVNSSKTRTVIHRHNHTSVPIEDFLDVKVEQRDNVTYVDAEPKSTGRESKLIKVKTEACILCKLDLENLSYTDVMILSQYIKRDGSLATFSESKLCSKQYRKVCDLIKQAQRCNLIKRPPDYLVPGPWHDLNTYLEPDRKRDQPMKIVKKQYWKL